MVRVAVVGHVEHVTLGTVDTVPSSGDIAHLGSPQTFPGGGGGLAFSQLCRGDAELHLFTAIGDDEAGATVEAALRDTDAVLHLARRPQPHTRDVVMVDASGERTILVLGPPLHPEPEDPLPWELLERMDAVYFTAESSRLLRAARAAKRLIATARRKPVVDGSEVTLDAVLGSENDPREKSRRAQYALPPRAVVMTAGARGGTVETETGLHPFSAPSVEQVRGAYGAGDSFAGAFTYWLASGLDPVAASERAAEAGAAVVTSPSPYGAQICLGCRAFPG